MSRLLVEKSHIAAWPLVSHDQSWPGKKNGAIGIVALSLRVSIIEMQQNIKVYCRYRHPKIKPSMTVHYAQSRTLSQADLDTQQHR